MSKRNLEGENDENETRKKYASLTGFSENTTPQMLKNLQKVNLKEVGGGVKESDCLSSFVYLYGKKRFEMKIVANQKYLQLPIQCQQEWQG